VKSFSEVLLSDITSIGPHCKKNTLHHSLCVLDASDYCLLKLFGLALHNFECHSHVATSQRCNEAGVFNQLEMVKTPVLTSLKKHAREAESTEISAAAGFCLM